MDTRDNAEFPIWETAVSMFLGVMLLSGGISTPSGPVIHVHAAFSFCLILAGLWRLLHRGFPTPHSMVGAVLVALGVLLVLFQLVPMPPEMWHALPMRDLAARNFNLLETSQPWMPLSLSPEGTRLAGYALLPGVACFVAVLTANARQLMLPCLVVLACAVVSVVLAVVQYSQGPESQFHLYDAAIGVGTGTFNNRNNFAAQLYTALPIVGVVVAVMHGTWRVHIFVAGLLGVVLAGVMLVGLAVSGSRSGIIFAMFAVVFAVLLANGGFERSRMMTAGYGLAALLLGLLIIGQTSMVGLLRIAATDPLNEYRSVISDGSMNLLRQHIVWGAGFGSFVPLFQIQEQPSEMLHNFVNHAHNDWLELAIEGGLAAVVLEIGFLAWYVFSAVRVWRYGRGGSTAILQRAASLTIPLLLLHSCLEFPLRTPALLSLFGFLCGLLCLPPAVAALANGSEKAGQRKVLASDPGLKPFRRPKSQQQRAVS